MAHSLARPGYPCLFRDAVNAHFYCSQCGLVARSLVLTSCCGDSYCAECFDEVARQRMSCSSCHEKEFSAISAVKYRREMDVLQVYCTLKERGCGWCGLLGELDAHLDPGLDNCQYVDVQCPLNCPQAVPKNKVEQHLSKECGRREHSCQHCGFKATYQEVVDTHLSACKYVPVQCPNFCGVTCEREDLEDHMKMCRLEEVNCEFSSVGCEERFKRELQEDHYSRSVLNHLALTAIKLKTHNHCVQTQLLKQERRFEENTSNFEARCKEVEFKLQNVEMQLGNKEKILLDQEDRLERLTKLQQSQNTALRDLIHNIEESSKEMERMFKQKIGEQQNKLAELQQSADNNKHDLVKVKSFLFSQRKFSLSHFSREKQKDEPDDWKSPAMYTHTFGYKFCVGIDANGFGPTRDRAIRVELWSMEGEYDDELKWPALVSITIELVNQKGRANARHTGRNITLNRVSVATSVYVWERIKDTEGFIEHDRLEDFLKDDSLHFTITECAVH